MNINKKLSREENYYKDSKRKRRKGETGRRKLVGGGEE